MTEWSDVEGKCVAFRFQDGLQYAVGPVEMDADSRVSFRVAHPTGGGRCAVVRLFVEPASTGMLAERMRRVFMAGLASTPGAMVNVTETFAEALA